MPVQRLKKSPMVVILYPTDFGITCTLEFKRFKEITYGVTSAGARLIGINVSSTRNHRSWK